jgi:hypothetical protein
MSKQTYIDKKITKCANCDRDVAEHQLWMHGKGICSKEPTEVELKIIMLKDKVLNLRRGLPQN